MLVIEYDGDLQTDLIASSVFELREGLDGDIDGSLDGQSMSNANGKGYRQWEGRNVDHSPPLG